MNSVTKNITLLIVIALVVGAITYIELQKPRVSGGSGQDIIVEDLPHNTMATSSDAMAATTTSGDHMADTSSAPAHTTADRSAVIAAKAAKYQRAKELAGIDGYINSKPFKLSDLVGKKVILLDFWTYSCINCQRTIPYLKAWYDKYKDQGFVIVGVHTPEFDFEKDYNNVLQATKDAGITYPVVQDNEYATWNAYNNRFWPREYLIDIDGFIVHDHIGEGGYDETEKAIQDALKERAQVLGTGNNIASGVTTPAGAIPMNPLAVGSQETYFGAERNDYLANGTKHTTGVQSLVIPETLNGNALYLGGTWSIAGQYAATTDTSEKIIYRYSAKNVYFVASAADGATVKVLRDGVPLTSSERGADVDANGMLHIKENRLYTVVNGSDYGHHTLELDIQDPNLHAFTFTFG